MQPYQQASEEILNQQSLPGRAIKSAAGIGLSIVGGGAVLKRVMPLLSKMIPSGLAVKGLTKVDPRFGKFIQGTVDNGGTQEEALNFIRDKVEDSLKPEPTSEEKRVEALKKFNAKKQKSPGIVQELQNRFTEQYGHPQQPGGRQPFQGPGVHQQMPGAQPQQPMVPRGRTAESAMYSNPQPQQPQTSNTDAAIIAALEKILSM